MKKEQIDLAIKVAASFNKFAKAVIKEKEKDPKESRDKNGKVHLHEFDLEIFCDKRKNVGEKIIPHKDLEALAVSLSSDYEFLQPNEIYWVLPHVYLNIHQSISWGRSDINMTYQTSPAGRHRMSDVNECIGIKETKNKFPQSFLELTKEEGGAFLEEVIEITLNDLNKKCNQLHLSFELELNCLIHGDKDETVNIDERLEISIKEQRLKIKGHYKGNPWEAAWRLQEDLLRTVSILEMGGILKIKDIPKRFGHGIIGLPNKVEDGKEITFKHEGNHFSSSIFSYFLHYFKDYLKRFEEQRISFIPLYHFALLSEKFDYDNLKIIPNFFSDEHFRFSRTEFFNYWNALEILLGNPESEIGKSLEKAYELFYPEEKSKEIKTIPRLYSIRNEVVHKGKFEVDHSDISEIKRVVSSLFNKVLLSRMTDKFYFSIIPESTFTMKDLDI